MCDKFIPVQDSPNAFLLYTPSLILSLPRYAFASVVMFVAVVARNVIRMKHAVKCTMEKPTNSFYDFRLFVTKSPKVYYLHRNR